MFPEHLHGVHKASKHIQANVAPEVIAQHFEYLPHLVLEVNLPLQLNQITPGPPGLDVTVELPNAATDAAVPHLLPLAS